MDGMGWIRARRVTVFSAALVKGLLLSWCAMVATQAVIAAPPLLFAMKDADFESLVFGKNSSAELVRRRMEQSIAEAVDEIAKACQLTESQQRKLRLASHGDIHDAFERVDNLRRLCTEVAPTADEFQRRCLAAKQWRGALRANSFQSESLFAKVLAMTLTDEQVTHWNALRRRRCDQQLKTLQMAFQIQPLPESREQLATALADSALPLWTDHMVHYIPLFAIGQMGDDARPLFDEENWHRLQNQLETARRLEPTLRELGVWPVPAEVAAQTGLVSGF